MSYTSESYKTVILFDSSANIEEIKEYVTSKNSLIITFDYESHKILSQQTIAHDISDNYITENDLANIQKHSYNFSRWYEDPTMINSLEYEGINLGELFYFEIQQFLVPFLKKLLEIQRICEMYRNSEFVSTPQLYEVVRTFSTSVSQLKIKHSTSKQSRFDYVEIPIKIGSKVFPLRIKQSHLSKIRTLLEKIVNYQFGPQKRLQNNKNTVLVVDLTTLRCRRMFSLLPKYSLNLIKYDRTIPAIWNRESYSIIKNSTCAIVNYSMLMDGNMKNSIKQGAQIIESKINSLLNHVNYFKSFFSINGISFWEIIKPTFMEMCTKRFHHAIQEIELAKKLLQKYKIKSIMVSTEIRDTDQVIIQLAKKYDIPVALVQHGLYYDNPERNEFNQFGRVLPVYSDKFIVWGKIMAAYSKKYGIHSQKIEVLGSLFFDEIFSNVKNQNYDNKFILLATVSPIDYWASDLTVKVRSDYELAIKKICEVVTKMNKKLVIKLHPSLDVGEAKIAQEVDPRIEVIKAGDIIPLIQSCEVLLTIDITTSILEGQILGKPVISVTAKDHGDPEVFRSKSCLRTSIDNFETNLRKLLSEQEFKQTIIENGNQFIENYLANHGTSTEAILSFLEKFNRKI